MVGQWLKPVEQLDQRRHSADDEGVEAILLAPPAHELLCGPFMDGDRQPRLGHDRPHGLRLLRHAVGEFDAEIGAEDRQEHARHAPAGADIEDPLAGGKMASDGDRIGDIARHEPLDIGVAGEVEPFVPFPEAGRVGRQTLLDPKGERERQALTLRPDGQGKRRGIEGPDGGWPPVGRA